MNTYQPGNPGSKTDNGPKNIDIIIFSSDVALLSWVLTASKNVWTGDTVPVDLGESLDPAASPWSLEADEQQWSCLPFRRGVLQAPRLQPVRTPPWRHLGSLRHGRESRDQAAWRIAGTVSWQKGLYSRLFLCVYLKNLGCKNSSFFWNSRPKTRGLFQNSTM